MLERTRQLGSIALLAAAALACAGDPPELPPIVEAAEERAGGAPASAYPVSAAGGTPATGPGARHNHCERIWCTTHRENFFIDHFLADHQGWILHDDDHGDVWVPLYRSSGSPYPRARLSMLPLCGKHVHPWLFGHSGAIRHTGFNATLGYSREHFGTWGTALPPCCVNGLGSAYVHSKAGRQFRFHDVERYRANPRLGWQRPHVSRASTR